MKKKIIGLTGFASALLLPVLAFAQTIGTSTATCASSSIVAGANGVTLGYIICKISEFINLIIPILIGLGVVYFIWGVVSYVVAKEEEAKTAGRDKMIYGLIGLAVIVSIWGLVTILKDTFGVTNNASIQVPCIPGSC
ncbi:MAG: hypothetical protein V4504_00940 [Patescibacteria group bacterium]